MVKKNTKKSSSPLQNQESFEVEPWYSIGYSKVYQVNSNDGLKMTFDFLRQVQFVSLLLRPYWNLAIACTLMPHMILYVSRFIELT